MRKARTLARQLAERYSYRDPQRYWNARHARHRSGLEGVGCISIGQEANEADYDTKWRHLHASLSKAPGGSRLLDAGCGNGFFMERAARIGFDVEGVDFSPVAVDLARQRLGNAVPISVGPLDRFRPARSYDVVMCIDVLFHVVDDDIWRATVTNLARMAGRELLIQDHLVDAAAICAGHTSTVVHCRWRTLEMYCEALPDWELVDHDVYELPCERETKDLLKFVPKR